MVSIIVDKPHALVLRNDIPVVPNASEVLVNVRRAGICGSDLHILHGSNPFARYPRLIGHEMAGIVEPVGASVTTLTIGASCPR